MTTITIDPEIKSELLKIAAQLQMEGKKKVNYNEAIKYLLSLVQAKKKDQDKFLKVCTPDAGVDPKQLVQELLHERRKDEREDS